jgi:hypothetical protein
MTNFEFIFIRPELHVVVEYDSEAGSSQGMEPGI